MNLVALFWGAVAFVSALTLSRWLAARPTFLGRLDRPNQRSLHSRPIPRTGGVAIMAGAACAAAGVLLTGQPSDAEWLWLLAALSMVALVSFYDDRQQLPPGLRLLVHLGAALLWSLHAVVPLEVLPAIHLQTASWLQSLLVILFLVWMTNLYNFMDGMDGFAAGMGVSGFGCLAMLGALAGEGLFTGIAAVIACACAGFLVVNFPPARLFMGDLGAASLGFLAAAFSLWGQRLEIFPLWVAVLVFSPFIVDASVTLLRRVLRGEKVWTAHRHHFYQRLVRVGWGHRSTVLYEYVLMLACNASAIYAMYASTESQRWLLGGWVVVYAVLILLVERRCRGLESDHHACGKPGRG